MIAEIKQAALQAGITAVITNSDSNIETQLNRLTNLSDLPILLISWDLTSSYEFDQNGFLKNPTTPIVCLLMSKADSLKKDELEDKAEEMRKYFVKFIQSLYKILVPFNRDSSTPVLSQVSTKLVPNHGLGKHSGVMGRFTMKTGLTNC